MSKISLDINSTIRLNIGVEMPMLGFGTWNLRMKDGYKAVLWALEKGIRLIDTATVYENEKEVGSAIKDSGIPREEIFITTKVFSTEPGYESTLTPFEKSIRKLNVTYVDLYLIHWPLTDLRLETWKALEKLYEDKKTRAIGVSNYTIRHLNEHFEHFTTVPTVNQVEFSPFLYQKDLLDFCKSHEIVVEAYSPLTQGSKLDNETLLTIGKKYGKSPAQILIRWGLQHKIVQIPKSAKENHIAENIDVFDFILNEKDMKELDNLNEDFRINQNPDQIK
ncbi:hypothetical protein LCGC14_0835610 [marine sediment metagenome]|uniref:NADP-dependent oxidoreductase domain-containing protein n=1 Tax=marine sediment metagenome TaxID=412755 RepID=A0A0F9PER1_9ZZZZ